MAAQWRVLPGKEDAPETANAAANSVVTIVSSPIGRDVDAPSSPIATTEERRLLASEPVGSNGFDGCAAVRRRDALPVCIARIGSPKRGLRAASSAIVRAARLAT